MSKLLGAFKNMSININLCLILQNKDGAKCYSIMNILLGIKSLYAQLMIQVVSIQQ